MKREDSKSYILAIVGPTAVGKSDLALELAESLETEIISADSMQVYVGMDIGTAKPTPQERARIPHHLIDVTDPKTPFSVSEYVRLASPVLRTFQEQCRPIVVCGGTGLYLMALLDGLAESPPPDFQFRAHLEEEAEQRGTEELYSRLLGIDPESALKIHRNDRKRIIRALEVYRLSGVPKSVIEKQMQTPPWTGRVRWFGIQREWKNLVERIGKRVDRMFEKGLVEEVQSLVDSGCSRKHTAMQALGYKEVLDYLDGFRSLEETTELIKKRTCRFARRQMSWFRPNRRVRWLSMPAEVPGSESVQSLKKQIFEELAAGSYGP